MPAIFAEQNHESADVPVLMAASDFKPSQEAEVFKHIEEFQHLKFTQNSKSIRTFDQGEHREFSV